MASLGLTTTILVVVLIALLIGVIVFGVVYVLRYPTGARQPGDRHDD